MLPAVEKRMGSTPLVMSAPVRHEDAPKYAGATKSVGLARVSLAWRCASTKPVFVGWLLVE